MKVYRFWRDSLPLLRVLVTLPSGKSEAFDWTRIYGVQVGPWFFGAIRGEKAKPSPSGRV